MNSAFLKSYHVGLRMCVYDFLIMWTKYIDACPKTQKTCPSSGSISSIVTSQKTLEFHSSLLVVNIILKAWRPTPSKCYSVRHFAKNTAKCLNPNTSSL